MSLLLGVTPTTSVQAMASSTKHSTLASVTMLMIHLLLTVMMRASKPLLRLTSPKVVKFCFKHLEILKFTLRMHLVTLCH